jgi:hypothetical protein
MLLKNEVKN